MYFYTKDVVLRKFSIMDIEFASSPQEMLNIIKGMYALSPEQSKKAVGALRSQLYVDFLFMPATYVGIYVLCMEVSAKMHYAGKDIFLVLAWLQAIAWLCDIIENIYLLNKIKRNPVLSTPSVHRLYLCLEALKWGMALVGFVCAFAAVFYFWTSGNYSYHSLKYLLIIVAEIALFLTAVKIASRRLKSVDLFMQKTG